MKILESFGISNIKKYYFLVFCYSAIFPLSNWVFYFKEYTSIVEIGVIDGIAILIGIFAELPTGVFGDLVGKKKSLILGYLSMVIGCFVIAFYTSFTGFLVGNSILFIGFAFISGAQEALAYDSMLQVNKNDKYNKVVANSGTISIISLIISIALGGFLFSIQSNLPWIVWGIVLLFGLIISLTLVEPKVDSEKFTLKSYLNQFGKGFKSLFVVDLKPFIIFIITLYAVIELGQGLIRQTTAEYFGLNGESFGYVFSICMMVAILFVYNLDKLVERFGEYKVLIIQILLTIFAYFAATLSQDTYLGIGVLLVLTISSQIGSKLFSVIINHRVESKNRATALSALAFLKQIPYIIVVLFFAHLAQVENLRSLFIMIVIGFSVITILGQVYRTYHVRRLNG